MALFLEYVLEPTVCILSLLKFMLSLALQCIIYPASLCHRTWQRLWINDFFNCIFCLAEIKRYKSTEKNRIEVEITTAKLVMATFS